MRIETDILVIGSGIAGLSFALKAAEKAKVAIVTKAQISEGSTRYAQGGIASVFSEDDSFESHIQDTLDAGAGLCNKKTVEITVQEGPERVRELIQQGVPFSKKTPSPEDPESSHSTYDLTREGGHRARRILHASDFTGQAIEDSLIKAVEKHPNITVYDFHIAIDLITNFTRDKIINPKNRTVGPNHCLGVYVLNIKNQNIHTFSSRYTVLATGGAGKVYLYTSNPDTATGDGIAMAARAGARIANMEFIQFHPTCLYNVALAGTSSAEVQAKSFLISEALRGEGGELIDRNGNAFMKKYHPMGSQATRDIVARAIDTEMKQEGAPCVYLDMTKLDAKYLKERFPNIYAHCLKFGIDLTKDPIPVVPAAHYTCGGVFTNEWGESSIENLFAIGEVACTGLHGANRLASNSLLEGIVFAERAFQKISTRQSEHVGEKQKREQMPEPLPEWDSGMAVPMEERINIDHTWRELRTLMWNYVGLVRTNRRLEKAKSRLEVIRHDVHEYYWNYLLTADLIELRNLLTVADLIVESALLRKESRGLHYTLDYPQRDDRFFSKDTVL